MRVEAAQTLSGKQVIVAWFENKQAVVNWYNSVVGQTPTARTWLATGAIPKSAGLGCVGCHKSAAAAELAVG